MAVIRYKIDAGDTVGSLAKHFHVPRNSIIEQLKQNGIHGEKVEDGTRYELPAGKILMFILLDSDSTQSRARSFGEMGAFFQDYSEIPSRQTYRERKFGTCTKEVLKDPKSVPLEKCSYYTRPQPVLKREDLVHSENLIRRTANAIQSIEEGGYGRVDTLGEWGCNTYHFHALIRLHNVKNYNDELGEGKELELIIRLMEENPQDVVLLYHTEELTNRFPAYSPNRNLVDWGDGNVLTLGSPLCDGLSPSDIGCRHVATFYFAIIPPEHELYSSGHVLPDGRRFVIWFGK